MTHLSRSTSSLDFAPVVLIADDNRLMREFCCEALDGKALRLLTAVDGQEALALAEAWIPDVLITDVAMPRLDGFGLIRALRRLYPNMPIIVMTGTTTPTAATRSTRSQPSTAPWQSFRSPSTSLSSMRQCGV